MFQDSANVGMPSLSRVGRILILFKLSEREISGHLEMGTVQKVSHTLYYSSKYNIQYLGII